MMMLKISLKLYMMIDSNSSGAQYILSVWDLLQASNVIF